MGLPLCVAVSFHAAHRTRLLGVEFLRQHHVSFGVGVLLCHHILGLQRYDRTPRTARPARSLTMHQSLAIPKPD